MMFDSPPSDTDTDADAATVPTLQRTRGVARVALSQVAGATRLRGLHQSGSAKAFLPKVHNAAPEVVFLNTAGGLTGGDRLSFELDLAAGARATGTTQTAERAYRSGAGRAQVDISLRLGRDARLDWLPQETILFDGSGLHRETRADLTGDATLLMCEMLTLGRVAMGEVISRLALTDRRRVTRDGRPVLLEPLALDTGDLSGGGPAGVGMARALATVALVAPGAEDALNPVRALGATDGVVAHATAWDGKLILRAMAKDPLPLRRHIARILTHLRRGPLPRVWQI